MRESEYEALLLSKKEAKGHAYVNLLLNSTQGLNEGVLAPFKKPLAEQIRITVATLRNIAEEREEIDAIRKMGRNSPEEARKANSSTYNNPLGDAIDDNTIEVLIKIVNARRDGDLPALMRFAKLAGEIKPRLLQETKELAMACNYSLVDALKLARDVEREFTIGLHIALSKEIKTREQAIQDLGQGRG